MAQVELTRSEKVIAFLSLWVSRLALAALAFAGMDFLIGGVDAVIRYPIAFMLTALLIKEQL